MQNSVTIYLHFPYVGISIARLLTLDGTWQSFVESFLNNASYVISTVLWVYWGVCISDMIPFYLGKLFRQSKASEDVSTKLGIGKEKMKSITEAVQKYENLMSFVVYWIFMVRTEKNLFVGVASVAAAVGIDCISISSGCIYIFVIWTAFPYLAAASTIM